MRTRRIRALSMKKSDRHGRMYYRNLATILVTMIVWSFTGLWHGASWNFILWGVYYGLMMVVEKFVLGKILGRTPAAVKWVLNFVVALVSFVIFYYTDIALVGRHLGAMIGLDGGGILDNAALTVMRTYSFFPLVAFIAAMPVVPRARKWMEASLKPRVNEVIRVVLLSAVLVMSVLFLIGSSVNPFIYFQF